MTAAPGEKAVRLRLNTTTNWSLPRDAAGRSSGPDEKILPLSPRGAAGSYRWDGQKEDHGHEGLSDGRQQQQQQRQGPESLGVESLISRPQDSLGHLPLDVVEELKKMIKEEVAQVAQVVQLKNSEADTPTDTSRLSPLSGQSSVFTPSYPSPPPSVIEALSSSKVSSPRDRSPEVTHAKTAPPSVPMPAGQSTPPVSPVSRAVQFRSRGPPVIHGQPRADSNLESVSPTITAAAGRVELSSVDKAWGMLFDSKGYSTQRLNSVLRGLAKFMIAELGHPETLVVTPDKMLTLYTKYKVEPERFQYEEIFRSRSEDALKRIEFLYQDLDCQYHLIQAAPRSHPNVPGLTPMGFAKWMINNILAYPDPEARRLHAIVSALPINADGPVLDGKPERLPRQLSRHLFPESHDKKVRKILDEAVWDCLEDVAPPLPSIPRARPSPSHELALPSEANTHARRPGSDPRRPAPVPHRRTYDRGSHRLAPHPARLPRANSDAGAPLPRHRDLPPPPMGRHSVPGRQRSPAPVNRYSASLPAISQHHLESLSPLSQLASAYDIRGSDTDYGVCSGRDGRGSDLRDESPRSPGLGRRAGAGAGAGADRGPTWEEVYSHKGSSGGRGSSVDGGSLRSSR
ncbi:uncharacterized protein ColSpa_10181 [Colletotrichum spaethianum]|uniref:DUF7514 domain-containing protein n=1 Tax=Colletotrichum spaethianum TaxID=700344 RepID=A0AA37PCZ6_9PEZI|nr:uncharacterized protein ColSpa_10181 [Colletotrichum spaethianum]GKT50000.1 hypothetical protein ColSpa_10181 [Colletotrichum spaethianum]